MGTTPRQSRQSLHHIAGHAPITISQTPLWLTKVDYNTLAENSPKKFLGGHFTGINVHTLSSWRKAIKGTTVHGVDFNKDQGLASLAVSVRCHSAFSDTPGAQGLHQQG
jgi:hypothetical protein